MADPNRNAAALLHNNNIRNNRFLDHQGSRVLHHNLLCPELLHRIPKYNSAPSYIRREPDYYTDFSKVLHN
jgi:hypothetical protein